MDYKYGAVFDLDGVLLDSESNLKWLQKALRKTLEQYGIEPSEENIRKIHPRNVNRFDRIKDTWGIQLKKLWATRNRNYIQEKRWAMKNRMIIPFPDVESLYQLKTKYRLGIISNSPQEIVDLFVTEFHYTDLFEYGIGRGSKLEDLKNMKPSPYFFELLRDKIPEEKLFYVGDSGNDRGFAENTGMEFILLSRNKGNTEGFTSLRVIVEYLMHRC
jgi:phosphoglycolate phosphatase